MGARKGLKNRDLDLGLAFPRSILNRGKEFKWI
jgi:hypothetical protein